MSYWVKANKKKNSSLSPYSSVTFLLHPLGDDNIQYITQGEYMDTGRQVHKLVAVTSSPAVSVSTCEYLCRRSSLFSSK